jgi:hypothetical protein
MCASTFDCRSAGVNASRRTVCNLARTSICLALVLSAPAISYAREEMTVSMGFDFYPYLSNTQDDTEFTLNTSITLPAGWSYFSFVNVGSAFNFERTEFLASEQNLRWRITERIPFDLAIQAIIVRGANNDSLQVGPRWRLSDTPVLRSFLKSVHAAYSISFFIKRFDQVAGEVQQISHAYSMAFPFISDRLQLSGFVDQNLHRSAPPGKRRRAILSETQLSFRLFKDLYGIAEYRRNEYRASDQDNLALGFEYRMNW